MPRRSEALCKAVAAGALLTASLPLSQARVIQDHSPRAPWGQGSPPRCRDAQALSCSYEVGAFGLSACASNLEKGLEVRNASPGSPVSLGVMPVSREQVCGGDPPVPVTSVQEGW